jgi:hypothetical protein
MDDGDAAIVNQDGRTGFWYAFNDETGTQTPEAPGVSASKGKICTSGEGFTSWGAGLGAALNADGTNTCEYNASEYRGITFKIEGVVAGGVPMRFTIPTSDLRRASELSGGSCVDSTTGGSCNDFFGVDISASGTGVGCSTPTSSWNCGAPTSETGPVAVTIPFSEMAQAGWPGSKSVPNFDVARTLALQWNFFGSSTAAATFNICVSGVSFY